MGNFSGNCYNKGKCLPGRQAHGFCAQSLRFRIRTERFKLSLIQNAQDTNPTTPNDYTSHAPKQPAQVYPLSMKSTISPGASPGSLPPKTSPECLPARVPIRLSGHHNASSLKSSSFEGSGMHCPELLTEGGPRSRTPRARNSPCDRTLCWDSALSGRPRS